MSIFNKALASLGIGATKIDCRFSQPAFRVGEEVKGQAIVMGGAAEQKVDTIYLSLFTSYLRQSNNKEYEDHALIKQIKIAEPFTILENEIAAFPFTFTLPLWAPVTANGSHLWIKAGADIKNAMDPFDLDPLVTKPSTFMTELLNVILNEGFTLSHTSCVEAPDRYKKQQAFIQKFVFNPKSGHFGKTLNSLTIKFYAESSTVYELLIELDHKVNTLHPGEKGYDHESLFRVRVRMEDVCSFHRKFIQIIEQSS
ncbi:sporulation protein [Jeotgalibacillus proteolyticus]|uniref:Sporulation protein SpoOM n=1 Tax=Jeotgalibacillus proteolyticus TaxID=2082395 RepID=A0A2S5GE85_9BACL|nr:sporulation protein [Jeotgalibacillus proteolyticus]PPA71193.1 hypothetical protein C4B60_03755 [Jeotgalibacillus proteolyticus]